jgi:2-polyprenyl-3-methyl-5-hydroxy-6-metoxy-1,4-benzoquinol methylase
MDHENWNNQWTKYQKYNQQKLLRIYDDLGMNDIPKDANILDIGCGTGDFIKILKERGFTSVHGIEPQADLVLKSDLDCIVVGSLLSLTNIRSTYDLVIILGVLHHLDSFEDVTKALVNVKRILKPSGLLYSLEPQKTLIRSILTQLMFALPMWILPDSIKLDRVLLKEELKEFNNWLSYEYKFPVMADSLGYQVKVKYSNWRAKALILTKGNLY